jgi:DNA polymerase I
MDKKLFLLDGMALVYRAHFALIQRPIFTSKGVNTSALYGFTQTLLEILKNQEPTHIAVAFDTDKPTQRHTDYAAYKATREAMPEDLIKALPHVRRMLEAFRIPALAADGYEADDLIGTLVCRAAKSGFVSYMVTPDKDFGQLVNDRTFIFKPGRMGDPAEILGAKEVCARWGIQRPEQVIDLLALMGDSVDNIPGVPGVGEKTAAKLIAQFGTVENLLENLSQLKGKLGETIRKHREEALLSKRLATLICDAPCDVDLEDLRLREVDETSLREILVEFEFNSLGRRIFGEAFRAGHGFSPGEPTAKVSMPAESSSGPVAASGELDLFSDQNQPATSPATTANLKTIRDVPHSYEVAGTPGQRRSLVRSLSGRGSFAFGVLPSGPDPKAARPLGLAFSTELGSAVYVPLPVGTAELREVLEEFRPLLESSAVELTGYDLKQALAVLRWSGMTVRARVFDIMIAHSLIEPDLRHTLDYLAEAHLGYTPIKTPASTTMEHVQGEEKAMELACEPVELCLRLRPAMEASLREKGQERVFYEVESPLVSVLVEMEYEGIKVDAAALGEFATQLAREMEENEKAIHRLAGTEFNLNSPRQLGQILFEVLKVAEAPKKTKTGQYSTDEQTLASLAGDHEIVRRLLDYRGAAKLKSTYADALPASIWPATHRVHTTYFQVMTSTGRLSSQNPNLQNIPIRTDRGQEIRKAFVPRNHDYLLLSADYSQIELRIIAALSREAGLLEAFRTGTDVHTATAARVFGVFLEMVTPEMRRKAKMVNYGIAYGISAFGLAQRLAIPRKEAAEIIEQYFKQFAGIRQYMDETIAFARERGYVQTITGRRRYIRDILSSNNTIRSGAERNAINAPIQGTAADMIKLAMIGVQRELLRRQLKSRMLLQVHDELVFELFRAEKEEVEALVESQMKQAIPLAVPIEVEIGAGENWLEAH